MFSVFDHRFLIAILLLLQVFTSAQDRNNTSSTPANTISTTTTNPADSVTSTDSSVSSTETTDGLPTTLSFPLTTFASTDFPTTTSSSDANSTSTSTPSSKSSNAGAIAGGVIGALAGLGVIAALILLLRRKGFFDSRGSLLKKSGPSYPPSPRLKNPWVNGIGGGVPRRQRPQRLESVGGESAQRSPSRSNQGHGFDDAHELGVAGYPYRNVSVPTSVGGAGVTGRSRSYASTKASVPEESRVNSRTSYDLSVFNSNAYAPPRGEPKDGDPFASETSTPRQTSPPQAGELARTPSGSRVTRKPAPKYDDSEPSTPITPRESKPPVSRPPRTRTYSNSSSLRAPATPGAAAGGGGGSSRSSLENAALTHRSSQGTLGGTFKFAGEKEGPVHFLMPDAPSPAMQ